MTLKPGEEWHCEHCGKVVDPDKAVLEADYNSFGKNDLILYYNYWYPNEFNWGSVTFDRSKITTK